MDYHENSVRERIYNIVVDDITKRIRHEGYKVLISEAYPDEGEPKYIVWVNEEEGKAYHFIWDVEDDEFRLGASAYNKAMQYERMRWQVFASFEGEFEPIDESEIPDITDNFLQPKLDYTKRTTVQVNKPYENPERETEMQSIGRFFSDNKVAAFILFGLLTFLLKQCFKSM